MKLTKNPTITSLMLILTLAPAAALAGAHKTVKPLVKIDVDPVVEAAVTDVVMETAERWNSQDYASVLGLWDPNEPFPTYLAEEQAQWFVGWDRLNEYLDPPRPNPIVEAIREEMYNIQVKQIGPDLAIAVWEMRFHMKRIMSNAIGETVRVSAVLRETDDGWRYIHWAESPKTAMVYIEDLYEQDVDDDWDEFFEEAKQRRKEVVKKKRAAMREQATAQGSESRL
ncbi:MAG: nuclear transport factor 2 family protein [Gammaproteobacteria bacterium]|nr:nuclear transport factor 2 family protein [Gammaproteobacteria bacterium]